MQTVEEIYEIAVLPLPEEKQLELASFIIKTVKTKEPTQHETCSGGIEELFGSVSLGKPLGSDNDEIDADLAREYGSIHEDEN